MRPLQLLHKTIEKELPFVHKSRMQSVMDGVRALFSGNKLSLTRLGRSFNNSVKTRSNIKRVDRLLGNEKLQSECADFYYVMNCLLIPPHSSPWIHIDWSCISSTTNIYVLRASLSMKGRAIPVYEEAHPKKNENNDATHASFLRNLKKTLPVGVKPIIVTDAGFRGPWFNHVLDLGWDFVGRVRNNNCILFDDRDEWCSSASLYNGANNKPKALGKGILTKNSRVPCQLVRYKSKPKGRKNLTKNQQEAQGGHSKKHAKAHKEPWILATSLPENNNSAKNTVKIYTQRMQIEENFRDTKCSRYGFCLKESGTKCPKRMNCLLLIAAIANFVSWVAGIDTKLKGKAADYQAQSSKFQSILSVVTLGREALKKLFRMCQRRFFKIIRIMKNITSSQPELVF